MWQTGKLTDLENLEISLVNVDGQVEVAPQYLSSSIWLIKGFPKTDLQGCQGMSIYSNSFQILHWKGSNIYKTKTNQPPPKKTKTKIKTYSPEWENEDENHKHSWNYGVMEELQDKFMSASRCRISRHKPAAERTESSRKPPPSQHIKQGRELQDFCQQVDHIGKIMTVRTSFR